MPRPHRFLMFFFVTLSYVALVVYSSYNSANLKRTTADKVALVLQTVLLSIITVMMLVVIGCSSAMFVQNKVK